MSHYGGRTWEERAKAAEAKLDKAQEAEEWQDGYRRWLENERLNAEVTRLQAKLDAVRSALEQCADEALAVMDPPIEEDTVCFGQLVHVLRICEAALDKEGT